MAKMEKKTLSDPEEKRSFDKGQLELVTLGGVTFGRATLHRRQRKPGIVSIAL